MTTTANLTALAVAAVMGIGVYLVFFRGRRGASQAPRRRVNPGSTGVTLASIGIGVVATGIAFGLTGVIGLAIAVGFMGAILLRFIRSRAQARVQRAIEEAYPDLIENLITRVRSGTGLMRALAMAGSQGPPSIARPSRSFWQSVQVSGDSSACLDELKSSWASPTGDLIVETVRVAHHAGGNRVVEVLRELADQVRRERNLRREVEAKQSWVRVAARVGVAAPWVVLILLGFRSEAAQAYNSPAGITLIVAGLALSIVAYRLMLALGKTPPVQRVFER